MSADEQRYQQLQQARLSLIQQLTELNSEHIRSQSQLSGIELNLNRCREAIDSGRSNEAIVAEYKGYEQEFHDIEEARAKLDQARASLESELQQLDDAIQVCI